eukprot:TRINITY_DN29397_c0_g1_i1.p2 TRINITY_DN29397_c0_g1~~TRINITY_DN29397_c0_g1_i1.p2  ORF type:complete len:196 (-),score=17.60 TRINITY_DN29397_c0_g1_i1:265-852(-)
MRKSFLSRTGLKKDHDKSNRSVSSSSSLRRSASETSSLSESQAGAFHNVEELKAVFQRFDANGDGKISASELKEIMHAMGCSVSEAEVEVMMKEADSDGDGFIDLNEFVVLNTKGMDRAGCMQDLKNAFKVFDLDRNGSISVEELYQVLRSLGDRTTREECKNMINGVDRNGDGQVNFEEFRSMMTSKGPSSSSN